MAGRKKSGKTEDPFAFFRHLAGAGVPFVIVGGAALALHGIPRSTLDIDVVVPASSLRALFSAADRAGLRSGQAGLLKLPEPAWAGQWVTFRNPRGGEWTDVFLEESKAFGRLMGGAVKRKVEQIRFCVAGLGDLERMKIKSGRPIDLADIALIRERRKAQKGKS